MHKDCKIVKNNAHFTILLSYIILTKLQKEVILKEILIFSVRLGNNSKIKKTYAKGCFALMNVLFIVLDGLPDISHETLGWKTPLQAAETKTLDMLADEGCQALMYTVSPGICPASEVAHWNLFSYKRKEFPGRAYFHALSYGIPLKDDCAIFMLNTVRVRHDSGHTYSIDKEPFFSEETYSNLFEIIKEAALSVDGADVYHTGGMEILAILEDASPWMKTTDPFMRKNPIAKLEVLKGKERDAKTVSTYNRLSRLLLKSESLINKKSEIPDGKLAVTVKWPSAKTASLPFNKKYGFKAGAVVSTHCFNGMGKYLGMNTVFVESVNVRESLKCKLDLADKLFREGHDFVFIHVKSPDDAAHTGDPQQKVEAISAIDRAFCDRIDLLRRRDVLLIITSDHSTPTSSDAGLIHGGDPVGVLFHGNTIRRDDLKVFDEINSSRGGLGQIRGKDLMRLILYYSRHANHFAWQ